jgi:hypothetical protein
LYEAERLASLGEAKHVDCRDASQVRRLEAGAIAGEEETGFTLFERLKMLLAGTLADIAVPE